jgi:D-alanyl-D-alanine carboxypeptidase
MKDSADRDLRNVILILVKGLKLYQSRAHTANKLLTSLMALPPTKRAEVTTQYVNSEKNRFLRLYDGAAQKQAEHIEKALSGDGDFLEQLRVYASQQFWE